MTSSALRQLRDTEKIRQLKARYCRLLNERNWAEWPYVFSDDCILECSFGGARVDSVRGAFPAVAFLRDRFAGDGTFHLCTNPEIEFGGPDIATATWVAILAYVAESRFAYGYYRDRYRRFPRGWLVEGCKYEPLRWGSGRRADEVVSALGALSQGPGEAPGRDRPARGQAV